MYNNVGCIENMVLGPDNHLKETYILARKTGAALPRLARLTQKANILYMYIAVK